MNWNIYEILMQIVCIYMQMISHMYLMAEGELFGRVSGLMP